MLIKKSRFLAAAALVSLGVGMAGCDIEAVAPMTTGSIIQTAQNGNATPVQANVTATFASQDWCQDEGAMAIRQLGSADVPIVPQGCTPAGKGATGQFAVTTTLVRTEGAPNAQTVVAEVLGNDLARLVVFPHGKHKHLLSVGLFLNTAQMQQAEAKLLAMPVFKRGHDTSQIVTNFSINVTNDLPKDAKFYLTDVAADNEGASDGAVLTLPQGGSENIALDDASKATLMQNGWVNLFTLDTR